MRKDLITLKKRIDILVCEKGLAESREKAKALIMAGLVYVNNQKFDKPALREQGWAEAGKGCGKLSSCIAGFNLYGCGRFHRRFYRLHATERGG